jgi:hypothetical protein
MAAYTGDMTATENSSDKFTAQDRHDVSVVLTAVVARALDELSDSYELSAMYDGFKQLITTAAMIGDDAFSQIDVDAELQQACKRILGSGRFDYYPDPG